MFTNSSLIFFFNRIREHVFIFFHLFLINTGKELLAIYQREHTGKAQKEAIHSHGVLAHPSKATCFAACVFLFAVTKYLRAPHKHSFSL